MDSEAALRKRLNEVEFTLTHLQNDYEALNETVLLFSKQFERVELQISQLLSRIDNSASGNEDRKPEDEKPPHY